MGDGRQLADMAENISDSFRALVFVGVVKAIRQEYQVYRTAGGEFIIFSPSSRSPLSFHMTVVPAGNVDIVSRAAKKKAVTTTSLLGEKEVTEGFASKDSAALRFDLLMTLYVMVAAGMLEMDRSGRNLVFSLKKQ